MRVDPRGPGGSTEGWARGFTIFGLGTVALFVVLLVSVLLVGSGGGHGATGRGHPSADLANATSAQDHSPTPGDAGSGGHSLPTFLRSFGFIGLAGSVGYLAVVAVWASLRRRWTVLGRHAASATTMLLLVILYLLARGGFAYNGHNWNRSFADASVVLYAVTLAAGPLARLWRPASATLAWRRETGVWATIAALMHVGIFWEWSLGWDWRRFFYPGDHETVANTLMGDRSAGLFPSAFNLANVVGLVALVYAMVLTLTSNDASQRWLKRGWSWLQERSTTMWLLVLLHTWLFAYYITQGQFLPVGTLWASFWMVLLLQTAAFAKTVMNQRRGQAEDPGPPTSPT